MSLRGQSDHLTNLGETTIKKSFESALNRTEDEFLKLKRVVDKFLDAIKKNGGKVFHVETGSIVMKIECTSCQGLLNLLKYLESEEFKQRLLDIAIMLKEIYKCVYHITFEVTQDSLRNILDSLRQTRPIERDTNRSRASADAIDFEARLRRRLEAYRVTPECASWKNQSTEILMKGPMSVSISDENDALVEDIIELLESPDRKYAEVILLIGKSGAGKSALINTIHKALTGKGFPIDKEGKGEAATLSMDLNRYVNCGVSSFSIKREGLKGVHQKLPHIYDCAGLANEYSGRLRELLELLIGGYIPPKMSIPSLGDIQDSYGIGALNKIFIEPNPEWKVTKIVFMQGCTDDIPRNLIECLRNVLKIHDEKNLFRKYQCGVFVLITKYDRVKDAEDSHLYGQPGDESITLEELEKVEKTLEEDFNYAGNRGVRRMHCVCLKDDNPYIDNIALKFLKRMIEPGVPTAYDPTPVFPLLLHRLGHNMSDFLHRISLQKLLIVVGICVAALAFLYTLLNINPTAAKNDTVGNTSEQGNIPG